MSNEKVVKCARMGVMATLLLLSFIVAILPMKSAQSNQQPTTIYVDPPGSKQLTNRPFILNVKISNVIDLYGFEFKLGYNTTILDIVQIDIQPFLNSPTVIIKNVTNEGEGWYWIAISSLAPAPAKTGSGTLVSITFVGLQEGTSIIDLYDTKLYSSSAQRIGHDAIDGSVTITSTIIFVDPPSHNATLGEIFTVNVTIANVTGLYGYDFKLGYNTTLLDCLGVQLPPRHFLEPTDPSKIFIAKEEVNDTLGFVWVVVVLLNPETPKSGSGTLTTITFNATHAGPRNASCLLDLYDTSLGDFKVQPIEHFVLDGIFFIQPRWPRWDINQDGIVDIGDIVYVAIHFGAEKGKPPLPGVQPYEAKADLNGDGIIDITDIVIIAIHFGEKYF